MLFKFVFPLPIILFWLKNTKKAQYLLCDSISQSYYSIQVTAKQQFTFLSLLIFCSLFVIQTFFTLIVHGRDDTIFGHLPPVQSNFIFTFPKFVISNILRNYASINSKTIPLFL